MIPDRVGTPEFKLGEPIYLEALQQAVDYAFAKWRADGLGGGTFDSPGGYGFALDQRPKFLARLTNFDGSAYYSFAEGYWQGDTFILRDHGYTGTLNAHDLSGVPHMKDDTHDGIGDVVFVRLADGPLESGAPWVFEGFDWRSVRHGTSNQFWTTNPAADDVGWAGGYRTITNTSVTLDLADHLKLVDVSASTTNVTIALPSAAAAKDGWTVIVRRIDSNTATLVTVTGDGGFSRHLYATGQDIVARCVAGTGWCVVARNGPFLIDYVGTPAAVRYTHPIEWFYFDSTTGVYAVPSGSEGANVSLWPATPTQTGTVTPTAQSWAGLKTFNDGADVYQLRAGQVYGFGYTSAVFQVTTTSPGAPGPWVINFSGAAVGAGGNWIFDTAGTRPIFKTNTATGADTFFTLYDVTTGQTTAQVMGGPGGTELRIKANTFNLMHLSGATGAAYWIENTPGVGSGGTAYSFTSVGGIVTATGNTVPGSAITGSILASLITGALTGATIAGSGITGSITTATLPAASLTGTTLPAGVTASSLTSVGTLTGGATGAGFTVALGTSTITGTLAPASGGTGANLSAATLGQLTYLTAGGTAAVASNWTWSESAQRLSVPSLAIGNPANCILERDGNQLLAQRNSTSPQTFRVYETWTDASNGAWLSFGMNGSVWELATRSNGTGSARTLRIGTAGSAAVQFMVNGTAQWQVGTGGSFQAVTDNAVDFGSVASGRPRDVNVARNLVVGNDATIGGALKHTGTTVGFYGVTAAARPTAYVQTYATATRTHANLTSADVTGITSSTTGSALAEPSAAYTQSEMQQNFRRLQDQHVLLRADLANLKQLVNSLIDDGQANGLAQ